jgi:hypothetical protein
VGEAVLTVARTSPVVGHTEVIRSPEPRHLPSYTPGISCELLIPSPDKISEAREERDRDMCRKEQALERARTRLVSIPVSR